jgi:magnesium-transporting ATPase (P-type)
MNKINYYIFYFQVGDIFILKRGDICPTDGIILDSHDSNLFVDSTFLDGKTKPSIKFPLKSTFSKN